MAALHSLLFGVGGLLASISCFSDLVLRGIGQSRQLLQLCCC